LFDDSETHYIDLFLQQLPQLHPDVKEVDFWRYNSDDLVDNYGIQCEVRTDSSAYTYLLILGSVNL